jgi:hypothetical protein
MALFRLQHWSPPCHPSNFDEEQRGGDHAEITSGKASSFLYG